MNNSRSNTIHTQTGCWPVVAGGQVPQGQGPRVQGDLCLQPDPWLANLQMDAQGVRALLIVTDDLWSYDLVPEGLVGNSPSTISAKSIKSHSGLSCTLIQAKE